jgi:hypothetical protein
MLGLLPTLKSHGIYFIEDRIDEAPPVEAPQGWTNKVFRWTDKPHSMLQVIRRVQ